jgi:septum formation protein
MTLPVVLASASPRRRDMLAAIGLTTDVQAADVDESVLPGEAPVAMALRLAAAKADAVVALRPEPAIVLAADPIVVLEGVILTKPRDPEHAVETLLKLQGREHTVITAFAAVRADAPDQRVVRAVHTQVWFRPLTEALIRSYVATGEPLDKAGAYGIQKIGAKLVREIRGSYTNVVGLPLVEVLEVLPTLGGPTL